MPVGKPEAMITLPYNWSPRPYQLRAWKHITPEVESQRMVLLWHRRAGKDLFLLNVFATKVMQRVGNYWHVFPEYAQARKAIWDGITSDGKPYLGAFHPETIERFDKQKMMIFFKNGSTYQLVGSDRYNALVGTNPVGIGLSEYAIQVPAAWDYMRPILSENKGWMASIYTPRGENHGFNMWNHAYKSNTWLADLRVAGSKGTKRHDGTPVISDAAIEEDRKQGMSESMIQQEYFVSFGASSEDAFWGDQLNRADVEGRIGEVPYDPRYPVTTSWDIGVSDATVIWFYQIINGVRRYIDYYENWGEGVAHYSELIQSKPYSYKKHIGPHDLMKANWERGGEVKMLHIAAENGLDFDICPSTSFVDGVMAAREVLPLCKFDHERCRAGINHLKNYQKQRQADGQIVFKARNNGAQHAADAFRYGAVGDDEDLKIIEDENDPSGNGSLPTQAEDNYDYLGGWS